MEDVLSRFRVAELVEQQLERVLVENVSVEEARELNLLEFAFGPKLLQQLAALVGDVHAPFAELLHHVHPLRAARLKLVQRCHERFEVVF